MKLPPILRRFLDRRRANHCERSLLASDDPEPTLDAPISQPVTAGQCQDPIYQRWCAAIHERPRLHRKQWEYVFLLRALEVHDMVAPGRRGLGFGVGREPIVAVLANAGCSILATDLVPEDPRSLPWQASGEYGGNKDALNDRGIATQEALRDRVAFAQADMRDLEPLSGQFDFLWSSCALEHLGSLAAGLQFLRDSLDRLRPGGVAVHTTEYNVSSDEGTVTEGPVVLYRRRDLQHLATELNRAGHRIELNFQTGSAPEDRRVDRPPHDEQHHLKVLYTHHATTSFGIVIVKAPDPSRG